MMVSKTCPICLDPIKKLYVTSFACNCTVKYHKKCLKQTFKMGILCPICRISEETYNNNNAINDIWLSFIITIVLTLALAITFYHVTFL
jgi:hypothetical protein